MSRSKRVPGKPAKREEEANASMDELADENSAANEALEDAAAEPVDDDQVPSWTVEDAKSESSEGGRRKDSGRGKDSD